MTVSQAVERRIVEIPSNVDVEIEGFKVSVKGPLGSIVKDFSHILHGNISIRREGDAILIEAYGKIKRPIKAMLGTLRAHIENMILGVTKGFTYRLKIIYSHFPISVRIKDRVVYIENFIGERTPRTARIVGDVEVTVDKEDLIVKGLDIEAVAQTAANIEQATKVRRKDPRVFLDGIYVYSREVGM
ncbi:MAG: 50S ribosomal protein L6 [Candidatus Bathyarchaeota archaeon]|nr:50S ribosomal protein L6 [Candidatus Bathyarchaeota archaeon]